MIRDYENCNEIRYYNYDRVTGLTVISPPRTSRLIPIFIRGIGTRAAPILIFTLIVMNLTEGFNRIKGPLLAKGICINPTMVSKITKFFSPYIYLYISSTSKKQSV